MVKKILIFGKMYNISLDDPRENSGVIRKVRKELKEHVDGHADFDILYSEDGTIILLFLYDIDDNDVNVNVVPADILRFWTGEGYTGSLKYPIVDKHGETIYEEAQRTYEKNNKHYGGSDVHVISTIITSTMMSVVLKFDYKPLKDKIMKKIFLCGQIYDLAKTTAREIQNDIQKRINEFYGGHSDRALAAVKIEDGKVDIEIRREYVNDVEECLPYNTFFNDEHNIFCLDSDLLLGRKFKDTRLMVDPGGVGFGYYYSWSVSEFIQLYKDNCKLLKVSKPKKMEFTGSKKSIRLTLTL